jgi:NADH-quinone oxidoreductase subunit E
MLTDDERQEIEAELEQYPSRRGACIEALKVVQRHRRWVSDEALEDLAAFLEMSAEELDNVATFYNLIYREPVGRHVILVCDSVSCWVVGYRGLLAALSARLGIGLGETTADDRYTLLPMACLGACDHAPVMMIDEDTHRDLAPEGLDAILERYE